ncbi:MAG: hypothetical protein DRH97_00840 [Chloroflexi bacterium]|nr:MAG: hypothetical protein DRH97_00840 [Chloroflexota bacterium]
MSTELAKSTDDFIANRLAEVQKTTGHNKAICKINPKQWCLVARHVLEDGMNIAEFNRKHGVKHWTYFKIRKELAGDKDYDEFRNRLSVNAAVSMELGNEVEDRMSEKLLDRIDDFDDIDFKEASQAIAQVSRANSMRLDRFQKLTGAATQRVVVEHKTTLDEAKAFALEAIKEAEIVEV